MVTSYNPNKHIEWIIKLPNTFLSNEKSLFEEFLKNSVIEDKEAIQTLKKKIEDKYGKKFNNIKVDYDLFLFPKFKI